MPRPTYLDRSVLQRASAARFSDKADRDIWSLGFGQQADDDIDSLASLIEIPDPAPPLTQFSDAPAPTFSASSSAPAAEPLPVVTTGYPTISAPAPRTPVPDTPSGRPEPMPTAPRLTPATITSGPRPDQQLRPGESVGSVTLAGGKNPEGQARVYQTALASGRSDEDARILAAVTETEGGWGGLPGDNGQSHGIYQFHERGEMPAFRNWLQQQGIQGDPYQLAYDPDIATRFAATTYLGAALDEGRAKGMSGAELATYVQQHGQRSVRPQTTGENYTRLFGPGAQSAARPGGVQNPEQANAEAVAQSTTAFTRNQGDVGNELGLPWARTLEICGPVAAAAFLRRTGRLPGREEAEAMRVAQEKGYWQPGRGMGGPGTTSALLTDLGVANRKEDTVDWEKVRADVLRGNPVIMDTPGHLWVIEGYDPATGRFNFGESAKFLKAAGGNSWFRPEEIAGLGMGAPRAAIYLDNPETAAPSAVAGRSETPAPVPLAPSASAPQGPKLRVRDKWGNEFEQTQEQLDRRPGGSADLTVIGPVSLNADASSPGASAASPSDASPGTPAGAGSEQLWSPDAPAGQPGAYQAATGRSGGQGVMLRGPLSAAPQEVGNGEYVDPDSGPREAIPGSVGAQPVQPFSPPVSEAGPEMPTSYNDPTDGGTISMPLPTPAAPSYTIVDGRTAPPTQTGTWEPVRTIPNPQRPPSVDPGQWLAEDSQSSPVEVADYPQIPPGSPYGDQQAASMEPAPNRFAASEQPTVTQQIGNGLKPVWDAAGAVVGYVQDTVTPIADAAASVGLKPGGMLPEQMARMIEIQRKAADDQGRDPFAGVAAVRDAAWRRGHPELAAEYDALDTEFGMGVGMSIDAPRRVAQGVTQIAARAAPAVDASLRGAMEAPNMTGAAGVAERIIEGQQPRALPAPAVQQALPSPPAQMPPSAGFEDFIRAADSPEQAAAREAVSQPIIRPGDNQLVREEFGRPWEEVAPVRPGNPDQLGAPTRQIVTEGQGFRPGRNRVYPDDIGRLDQPHAVDPGSLSANATPGVGASASLVNDLSNSVGGGVFGAAAGAALPADSDEERRQNALRGAAIGMVGAPVVGRLMTRAAGALATPGVSPNRMGPAMPRQDRAAEVAGRIALSTQEEIARLRLDKFPDVIRDDLLEAAQQADFGARLRRGVLSDEAVRTLAAEYAPSIEQAIAGSRRGRAYSAEEIIGLRNLLVNQALTVRELGELIAGRTLPVDEHTAALARLTLEQQRLTRLAEVAYGGAPAEAGRALRQFRQLAQNLEQDPSGAGLRYLRQQFGTLDRAEEVAAQYMTMVAEGASPVELAKFLRSAKGGWLNRLSILRYGSMLSATTTHLINGTGNLLMQGVDIATTPLAVGVDVARSGITGAPRQVFMAELPARLHGMAAGARTGLSDAAFIMQHGLRPEDVTKLDQLHQGFGTNIPGIAPVGSKAAATVDFLMEGPLRALSAADAIFRSTANGGHLAAEATSAAMQANGGKKATAEAIQQFMSDPKVIEAADAKAARSVLQEQRQEVSAINGMIRNLPPAGQAVVSGFVPFIRTPYNLVAQGVGMTPAGIVPMIRDIRAGKPARGVEERVARMAIGTAVMGVSAWDYLSGNLTGPRPESEAERSTLPPGWREWSRKVTLPNGEVQYIPLASLGPLAIPSVISILIAEGVKQGKGAMTPERAAEIGLGMGQFASDQTFLRGVSDLAGIFDRGGSKIENAVENLVTQLSPHALGGGAIGRQIQQIMGMPQRDPEGAIEALLATHPLTADRVPVRRDVVGRPVQTTPGGVQTAIAPFRASVERDLPVIRAYRAAKEGLPMAAPKQARDPYTGETRTLNRSQQARWRIEFGQALRNGWDGAGQPTDAKTLRKIESDARDAALSAVLGG